MRNSQKLKQWLAVLLVFAFLATAFAPSVEAQRRKRPSKTKNIAVGTAVGAVGGALIGGRKGALIGAGAGAGAGTAYHVHKKRSYRKRHPQ